MAGYSDYSKSNNAIAAEAAGKFPASAAGRMLSLPAKFISEICNWATHGEWHHSSKYYNSVPYYDVQEIRDWINGDVNLVEEHGDFEQKLKAWKTATKIASGKPAKLYTPVSVTWLEWGGTRSHPRATPKKEIDASIIDTGGKFVTVKLSNGQTFKKGRDTNGFEVLNQEGKRIYL